MFLKYEQFNEAYYSKNHNLWKVAGSSTPIMGVPIFTPDDQQNFFSIRRTMEEKLKGYQQHVETSEPKMADYIAKATTKGERERLQKANELRKKAFDIVQRAAAFMIEFNELYDSLKEDLFGKDHTAVANAIIKLNEIQPHGLIKEAGVLKRMNVIRMDSEFVKSVLKWVDSISRIYETFDEAGKVLGKTEKQIEGARKQSFSQRMRWGM
jgi:hypothetical protein